MTPRNRPMSESRGSRRDEPAESGPQRADAVDLDSPPSTSRGTGLRPRGRKRSRVPMMCLAGLVLAVAATVWLTQPAGPATAHSLRRLLAAGATTATAATLPASAASTPPADPDHGLRAAIDHAFAGVHAMLDHLLQRSDSIDQRLDHLEADVGDLRQILQAQQAARKVAARRMPKPHVATAAASAAAPAAAHPASPILSVDLWNGQPSVSIRQGDVVRFVGLGDTVEGHTIEAADATRQRVEVRTPSGTVVPVAAAGEAP